MLVDTSQLVIGERVQIDTGVGQGVARVFAPRPIEIPRDIAAGGNTSGNPGSNPFAFYDPDSVSVNVLEQALVNDATGTLGLRIGQPGERGLTVDIDWGGPTRRFQQINGLSADASTFVGVTADGRPIMPVTSAGSGTLTVQHFYDSQDDIVNSRLNGRTSATEPLQVRFAVRQHESILVRSDSVVQNEITNPVMGRLASSTDNPLTPGLESGGAQFTIPSLTIPAAFIPVRDVIPEFESPTFVMRPQISFAFSSFVTETTETASTSTITRDEFLQLRVLSPDPDGPDLVAPLKLPDNILEGDRLQELLSRLPDGSYVIEYVIGDGNTRPILRVDVRDGEATIPEVDLNEGELELKRLDVEAVDGASGAVAVGTASVIAMPTLRRGRRQIHATENPFTRASRFGDRRSS